MDISKLKNLVKQNGDKVIFMENGEPEFVIISFTEYEKLAHAGLSLPEQRNALQEIRQNDKQFFDGDINTLHETEFMTPVEIKSNQIAGEGVDTALRTQRNSAKRPEGIRLEDLPI